jgi:hypothetical protein
VDDSLAGAEAVDDESVEDGRFVGHPIEHGADVSEAVKFRAPEADCTRCHRHGYDPLEC